MIATKSKETSWYSNTQKPDAANVILCTYVWSIRVYGFTESEYYLE